MFGKDLSVGLTVSSQLPLEALATGLTMFILAKIF